MPMVSRSADHLLMWWGCAAVMAVSGNRRAAGAGVAAMLPAAVVANLVGKRLVRRSRPPLVMRIARPGRVPESGAFPSGHTAAAAAFATAAVLVSRAAGVPVCGAAVLVAYSRLYTRAHYPADVAAGTVIGIGTALILHRLTGSLAADGRQFPKAVRHASAPRCRVAE